MQEEQNRPKEDRVFTILFLLQSKEAPPLISAKGEIKYKPGNQMKLRELAHEFVFLSSIE